jgi:hypothetical protein
MKSTPESSDKFWLPKQRSTGPRETVTFLLDSLGTLWIWNRHLTTLNDGFVFLVYP